MKWLIYALGIVTSCIILLLGMVLLEKVVAENFRIWAGVLMSFTHTVVIVCCVSSYRVDIMNKCKHEYSNATNFDKAKCVKCGKLKTYN